MLNDFSTFKFALLDFGGLYPTAYYYDVNVRAF